MFTLKNQLYYAYWGFIIGDALGVPHEFSSREEMRCRPAEGMIGWGTYQQPPGTWSDDTSMMLCVLENLFESGDRQALAGKFVNWYRNAAYTAHDHVFDIGIATRSAIENLLAGLPPHKSGAGIGQNAGNGALMRSLPYAFMNEFSKFNLEMILDGRITHQHWLSSLCCTFYNKLLRSVAEGYDKELSMSKAKNWLLAGWRIVDGDFDIEKKAFSRLMLKDFALLAEYEIKSNSYVLSTLEAAVWCFLNSDSYKDAVVKAVQLGGDTDTIAALTGSLAAVHYREIPLDWKSKIVKHDWLEKFIIEKIS